LNITTVIPAYKPKYLAELLNALLHQTVRPTRVIFSDDSPDRSFIEALTSEPLNSATASLNVEVIDGPHAGAFANCLHLLKAWSGSTPLVHFLMDDDIVYPLFYERHLEIHATGRVDCSVSRRWTALESGQPVGMLPVPSQVFRHPNRLLTLEPEFLLATTLPYYRNWLGELSNAVFNFEVANILSDPQLGGISFEGLGDIGLFLSASLNKPIGFINEALGYFRLNPAQNTQAASGHTYKCAHLAWIALILGARRLNRIPPEQAVQGILAIGSLIRQQFAGMDDVAEFDALLPGLLQLEAGAQARFVELWHEFLKKA
jgi:hypothetical protein